MGQSARFWDIIANRYARQPIADEEAYQKKLEITRSFLRPDMELLELGCGTGSTAILHAPHVKHILAIDISEKMLQIARNRANAQNISNITFRQSAIEDFSAADESVDMVLCLSILHLLEDREAVIDQVFKILRPGGLFVSSTTCLGDMNSLFKYIAPVGYRLGLLPLVRSFSVQQLANSINNAGFSIELQWQPPGKGKAVFIVARKPV